jgi:hypothetical protein
VFTFVFVFVCRRNTIPIKNEKHFNFIISLKKINNFFKKNINLVDTLSVPVPVPVPVPISVPISVPVPIPNPVSV